MWLVLFWLILSLLCPLLLLLQLVGQVSPVDPVVDGWLVGIFRASSPSAFSCRFSLCLPPSKQNEKQREREMPIKKGEKVFLRTKTTCKNYLSKAVKRKNDVEARAQSVLSTSAFLFRYAHFAPSHLRATTTTNDDDDDNDDDSHDNRGGRR